MQTNFETREEALGFFKGKGKRYCYASTKFALSQR